ARVEHTNLTTLPDQTNPATQESYRRIPRPGADWARVEAERRNRDMDEVGRRTVATIIRRLMPLLGLMYLIAYNDRQNVSYAKLQMVGDLGLSETAYGLGASLFFIGYFIFEVPSNVILERVGARLWFARIMATWGLVTLLLAFTRNATMFYVLRFLLG